MSIWRDIHDRSNGREIRKEDSPSIEFSKALNYSPEEEEMIRDSILDLHKFPIVFPLKESSYIGNDVYVSEERKTYQALFKTRFPENKNNWEELRSVCVLGEYKRNEKKIILYINNIKEIKYKYCFLLSMIRYVYLHELMHAFFDRTPGHEYIYELEEAFAEFGALYCLAELVSEDKADSSELDWVLSHVGGKQGVLECYSYGSSLFKRYEGEKDLAKKILESYL